MTGAGNGAAALGVWAWPEVATRGQRMILAVPLGPTEQHGLHLPLDTDTRIAVAVAEGLASARRDVVVAPTLPYGSSGEHTGFPGTISIGQEALEHLLVELVRSLAQDFWGTVFVSGHAGNAEPLQRACGRLVSEGRRVLAWLPLVPGGDAHAGRTETSLMMALHPDVVRTGAARPGYVGSLSDVLGELRRSGVRAVSPTGVLGDPEGASAADGEQVLALLVADLGRTVDAWAAEKGAS